MTTPAGPLQLLKGHGTGNDFLLALGPDASTAPAELDADLVAALCDRRFGIGADGVIRAVPPNAEGNGSLWFMDYRNADGSLAQMCGNGARVFVASLVAHGYAVPDEHGRMRISTRAGEHDVRVHGDGTIEIAMGPAVLPQLPGPPQVAVDERTWPAVAVLMPNPHAVVLVHDLDDAGPLTHPPLVTPPEAYPEGVNVEFVRLDAPGRLALRVHERGSGETLSCGTGACAAAAAAARHLAEDAPADGLWQVDVPGGRLHVTLAADGVHLRGPAALVATVVVADPAALLHRG